MHKQFITCLGTAALFLATGAIAESDQQSKDWAFTVEPYGLITSIEGDTSLGRITGVDLDVDFSTILENLDLAAMVHFEAIKNNQWGVILDYGFMDLSSDASNARGGVVSADLRQGVLEAFIMRRYEKGENALDVYAGIRWWDNDIGVSIDPALLPGTRSIKVKQDWVDPVIGVRWHHPINEKWNLVLRGDIGGFGVASDFTTAVGVSAFYSFKSSLSLELAYRATWVDFEDGTRQTPGYFAYDTVTHGPLIGLAFKF